MDFTLYWFMFPVAMCVSTFAMMTGIGGSALFIPIYVLLFPILGAQYSLDSTFQAVLVSLITMGFSFASGVGAYAIKKAINYNAALHFLMVAVPAAAVGSWLAASIPDWILLALYSVVVFAVATALRKPDTQLSAKISKSQMTFFTAVGGFSTGSVAVGIGEVTIPQLLKRGFSPSRAAGTSVFIVFITVLVASLVSVFEMTAGNTSEQIPINILCYTIPGVLIGAQIGSRLSGMVDQRKLEVIISVLFFAISFLMLGVAISKVGFSVS